MAYSIFEYTDCLEVSGEPVQPPQYRTVGVANGVFTALSDNTRVVQIYSDTAAHFRVAFDTSVGSQAAQSDRYIPIDNTVTLFFARRRRSAGSPIYIHVILDT